MRPKTGCGVHVDAVDVDGDVEAAAPGPGWPPARRPVTWLMAWTSTLAASARQSLA